MAASSTELPVVRVICGPTAAGKSALALALCERFGGAIVSADSRQVYRGFDVGTAKPTPAERAAVPHFGLDVADASERYSAARWAQAAEGWLADAAASGRTPVVVGGTGLYVRALVAPIFEEPPLDAARRSALQPVLAVLSTDELRRWVRSLDPARAHLGRTQLLRAAEVALLLGARVSDLHVRHARAPRWDARYLVVDPGGVLADAIERRVRAMLAAGWAAEVARLIREVPADAPAWNASGYRVIRRMVEGEAAEEAAVGLVAIETRQYAKRQRTWFRHQLPAQRVTRLDPRSPHALEAASRWWEGAET